MNVLKEYEHEHPHRHLTSRQRSILVIALVSMMGAFLLITWIFWGRLNTLADDLTGVSTSVSEVSLENNRILDKLLDCTEPTGQCAREAQERTGGAIQSINQVSVVAVYCAHRDPPQELEEVQACVEQVLRERR